MIRYKNLWLIGTSHVARQSIRQIKHIFKETDPGIVAVELDQARLNSLLSGSSSQSSKKNQRPGLLREIRSIGLKGFLFALIGSFIQKRIGKIVNIEPGSDMITAVKLARREGKKIALIDQDIRITLRRFSKTLSWKERWHFVVDLTKGLLFPMKQAEELGIKSLDLNKVPEEEVVEKLIARLKERYPNVYKSLIADRNKIMATRLASLIKRFPEENILAVVGAGHSREMMKLIRSRLGQG